MNFEKPAIFRCLALGLVGFVGASRIGSVGTLSKLQCSLVMVLQSELTVGSLLKCYSRAWQTLLRSCLCSHATGVTWLRCRQPKIA